MKKTDVETDGRKLIMTRTFDATREVVFDAYSDCAHLKNWWGPRQWPMEECTLDFREGGTWHYCLRGPNDGDESWGKGIYKEIIPAERIVYEDYFADEQGNINRQMPGMQITLEFRDSDGGTRLVSSTLFPTEEDLNKTVEMGVAEGMTETWDRLEEHLPNMKG